MKHLDRIKWRMSGNGWKANEKDLEAFNGLVNELFELRKQRFDSSQQFAKLYIYLYMEFLRYFDCTVYEKHPERTIQSILKRSTSVLIQELTYTINQQNLYDTLKENGFIFGHPLQQKEDVKKRNMEIMERTKGEKFATDEVTDNIIAMVNNAIKFETENRLKETLKQ